MILRKKVILALAIATLLLTSCGTLRNVGTGSKQNEKVEALIQPQKGITDLTAKTAITVDYDQEKYSFKGRLRMRRNEVVQLSITALGVVEVALIEFTPDAAYILDRVNKRYTKLEYSTGLLNTVGVNFSTIQALFWNRIFIPGKDESKLKPESFKVAPVKSQECIVPNWQGLLKCYFYTDEEYEKLQQTELVFNNTTMTWHYDMFSSAESGVYPTVFDISVSSEDDAAAVHIALNNVNLTDKTWSAGTNLERYKRVEVQSLLSILKLLK